MVAPERVASNISRAQERDVPSRLETVGGVRVGIIGVADPALASGIGATAEDPVAAAKREAAALRSKGAELVIALAPVEKPLARRIARDAAVDLVVLGRQVGHGMDRAEKVGNAFLVASADELQRVGRIDIVWRGKGPLVDARRARRRRRCGAWRSTRSIGAHRQRAGGVDGRPSGGDQAFIAGQARASATALVAERAQLDAPWKAPDGTYFTNRLIPLRRSLPRDEKVAAQMRKLDAAIAAINLKSAKPPPPAEPGRPFYVGDAKCTGCHKTAAAFWKKTVHASAWKTLVDGGKQNDYKCVGCHVTGYGEVGGSSLGHTDRLRNVQCETCHGPGSTHVAEEGTEDPPAVHKQTPASTCTACHTEQHSDTFQYEAYLRDIIGAGHGASARKKLGDGPTGHDAAHRRARAREDRGRKAEEGRLTVSRSTDVRRRRRRRRSAAGRAGRARCCRR